LVEVPMEGMDEVMQAKLVHAGSLLEAIAMENYPQIRQHADALTWLSERADWKVHTTEAYGIFSKDFRENTKELSQFAGLRDIDAVAEAFVAVTESCFNCHSYLRKQGLIRETPGSMTRRRSDVMSPIGG
jgi:hypothetical protein